jgi:hypothetical protein
MVALQLLVWFLVMSNILLVCIDRHQTTLNNAFIHDVASDWYAIFPAGIFRIHAENE